jgi:hypothetical protein
MCRLSRGPLSAADAYHRAQSDRSGLVPNGRRRLHPKKWKESKKMEKMFRNEQRPAMPYDCLTMDIAATCDFQRCGLGV